jgi:hypothetical protein
VRHIVNPEARNAARTMRENAEHLARGPFSDETKSLASRLAASAEADAGLLIESHGQRRAQPTPTDRLAVDLGFRDGAELKAALGDGMEP